MTISESSQVVWDCRLPVLQHGEVTTRSQQLSCWCCCVLVVTSPTRDWSSMLRNVWHLAMNRVISSTFPWIWGFVWFSTRMVPRKSSKMVPRSARHWLIEGRGNAGLDPESAGAIGASMRTEAFLGKAAQIFPGIMLLGLDLLVFCQCFHCFHAFWVEDLSDNFWRTPICFLSDRRILILNQPAMEACFSLLAGLAASPFRVLLCHSCATMLHATTQFNYIAFNLAARKLSSRWCFYKIVFFELQRKQFLEALSAARFSSCQIECRWTGQPVLCICPGLYLCEHASVSNFGIRKMWHCRCSLSPVDDERSTCPSVQESKVRFDLQQFSR